MAEEKELSAVAQRLKILMDSHKMGIGKFSKKIGVADGTTRNHFDRGTKPSFEYLEKVQAAFPSLNIGWLLSGNGPMMIEAPIPKFEEPSTIYQRSTSGNNVSNNVGTNTGTLHQNSGTQHFNTTAECEVALAAAQDKIRLLESQLTDKERLIQALERLLNQSSKP